MTQSFSVRTDQPLGRVTNERRRVLVTGAAGRIGSYFAEHAHEKYQLRLMVQGNEDTIDDVQAFGEIVTADLGDLDHLKQVCQGIDTVVHLAGNPDPAAVWSDLLEANIVGTYNMLVAAKAAGCRRVVYASSIHAVSGYPGDVQVKTNEPVNPGDLYGVSKCFGEALGRYMAEQEGLSVIALRIGGFQPIETAQDADNVGMLESFVSQRDLHQLIERSIDVDNLRWAVFHGLSNNRFKRLDISDARVLLGYAPEDDFAAENPETKDVPLGTDAGGPDQMDQEQSGIREEV